MNSEDRKIQLELIYIVLYFTDFKVDEVRFLTCDYFTKILNSENIEYKFYLIKVNSLIDHFFSHYKFLGSKLHGDYSAMHINTFNFLINQNLQKICLENEKRIIRAKTFHTNFILNQVKTFDVLTVSKK